MTKPASTDKATSRPRRKLNMDTAPMVILVVLAIASITSRLWLMWR